MTWDNAVNLVKRALGTWVTRVYRTLRCPTSRRLSLQPLGTRLGPTTCTRCPRTLPGAEWTRPVQGFMFGLVPLPPTAAVQTSSHVSGEIPLASLAAWEACYKT